MSLPSFNQNSNQPFRAAPSKSFNTIPKGYCFAFHSAGKRCTNQAFRHKHSCPKCQDRHLCLNTTICTPKTTPSQSTQADKILPTPININVLSTFLDGYSEADYILEGFQNGFMLHFDGPELSLNSTNSASAQENPQIVQEKIKLESSLDRISGPFKEPPLKKFKCSPLALREKQNTGKYRLLHNLSYPYDKKSVNYNILKTDSTVSYATISDAVDTIQQCSPKAFLAKSDIADAFRLVSKMSALLHFSARMAI